MLPTVKQAGVQVATAHVAEFELQVKFELVVSVLGLVFAAVELLPRRRCMRCTMVNRAQPGLEKDVDIYKTLHRTHGGEAGMWTQVAQPSAAPRTRRTEQSSDSLSVPRT